MARISWKMVCKPKVNGVGVVDIKVKNRAIMAKWIWRFATKIRVLWSKIIKGKCKSSPSDWRCKSTKVKNMSIVWRGIVENAKQVGVDRWIGREAFRLELGNGKSILF